MRQVERSLRASRRERLWLRAVPTALFGGIALLAGADLASDVHAGHRLAHLAFELPAAMLALVGVAYLALTVRGFHGRIDHLGQSLETCHEEAARWETAAHHVLDGLGIAIDREFGRWGLTEAESEVGLLLLKGLSHKEIAAVRATNEATVRQQALSLYRKSGLGGRAALSAFFIEDLLSPPRGIPAAPSPDVLRTRTTAAARARPRPLAKLAVHDDS